MSLVDKTRFLQLQTALNHWQLKNFGPEEAKTLALGVAEEVGELCHHLLKRHQGIRGGVDKLQNLHDVADAIGDTTIYLMQVCTALDIDFVTVVINTAEKVMQRDWTKNKKDGGDTDSAPVQSG